jgi:hypothetical protein
MIDQQNVNQKSESDAFWEMSLEQRKTYVRHQVDSGKFDDDQSLPIRVLFERASVYGDFELPYYRYRMAIEARDPAIVQAEMKTSHDASYFLESYGVERSKPFLSSRLWLEAYHYRPTPEICEVIKSRGAEQIAEELQKPVEDASVAPTDIVTLGYHFVEIFGFKSLYLLAYDLAKQVKGRHLENELGL